MILGAQTIFNPLYQKTESQLFNPCVGGFSENGVYLAKQES